MKKCMTWGKILNKVRKCLTSTEYRDVLKAKLDAIPEEPGIYKMFDSKGNIIYVGKSKCLKKRVKSYFVGSPKWEKVKKMVPLIRDIEYIVTDTHLEAMLLECKLIKEIQPYFNVQMKNDNRYVYLKIGAEHGSAPLTVVHERGKDCYGPFRSKNVLQNVLDVLKNIYPIEKNEGKYQFDYHVLPVLMNSDENERNGEIMKEILLDDQKVEVFTKQLEKKMNEEAASYHFESAAKYRDIVQTVHYLKNGIDGHKELLEKNILLKLKIRNGYKLIFVSKGQVISKERYAELSERDEEIFLEQAMRMDIQVDIHDKSYMDYRDILFSEILKLPKECIVIFEN